MSTFRGSWALVTGASGGIGESLARELGRRGANVVLTARSAGKLRTIADEIASASGVETRVLAADLSTEAGIWQLLVLVDALGVPIDHVVANAGFGSFGEMIGQTEREQLEMVMLNCGALTVLARHFLPGQIQRRRGGAMIGSSAPAPSVRGPSPLPSGASGTSTLCGAILVASTASFQPTPLYAVYGATKHYVRALGEALAAEVAGTGVTISVLCPGPVPTGFQSRAKTAIAPAQQGQVLTPDETARLGLDGYERGRVVVVPGRLNRALAAVSTALPNRIVVPSVLRMMRGKDRS